jgi:hypothetical protein
MVRSLNIDEHLEGRASVTIDDYERIERLREASFDCPNFVPGQMDPGGLAAEAYRDTGLLVLRRVTDHRREYDWA